MRIPFALVYIAFYLGFAAAQDDVVNKRGIVVALGDVGTSFDIINIPASEN